MAKYFLGVDGGQSSTTALIGDGTGRVIGAGRGGPCNHVEGPGGREKFINAIGGCTTAALKAAGLSEGQEFETACLGFSGGPADKEELLTEILKARKRIVTNDALIALAGAHAGGPGIITIAGTGSISFGRNSAGKVVRSGGWGYIYGDEGGGFDITRQAVRAALRMEEGWGPKTVLREKLLSATGSANSNELLHRFYTVDFPRPRVAGYSILVDEAATGGDKIAEDILNVAAQQLAATTAAVRRQIFAETDEVSIAHIGGVFRSSRLLDRFRTQIELNAHNHLTAPKYGPAAGALLDAYRTSGQVIVLSNVPEFEKS